MTDKLGVGVIDPAYIKVGCEPVGRDEAIEAAGELLVARGVATPAYVAAMHDREATVSTYLGNGVALPHGTFEAKDEVLGTGIVILQYPEGVEWPNGTAHLVIGLAARNEDHVDVLSRLADVLQDEALAEALWTADDPNFIYHALTSSDGE